MCSRRFNVACIYATGLTKIMLTELVAFLKSKVEKVREERTKAETNAVRNVN